MTSEGRGLRTIFAEAVERPTAAARETYLDAACAGDPVLRARVEDLLRAHGAVGDGFLGGDAETAGEPAAGDTISERPGDEVGRYKLLEQIGEGGFGVVFMAEQEAPVRRRVALKILKPGMDSRQVIARFEAERQALAMMEHPGIARVLDAGATASGRPFFVMELVRGVPITTYCVEARLDVRQRLGLFVQVCRAVQHAHQKGVIHRDLKPTNVLVTLRDGTPVVKVIDFGVAKAIHQRLTERTLFTRFAQIVGTPLYMSPEQAALSAIDVDTRADVYALGTLLYEMLTGDTPFSRERFAEAAYDEIRRVIREEDPPTPSQRVSTSAEGRPEVTRQQALAARELTLTLRGELDWIVMKALEKDRTRRYESASAFAADVERYLTDEPVLACPPSTWYRAKKFARRNRGALVTASVVALALLVAVGAIAGSIGWRLKERSDRAAWVARDVEAILTEAEGLRDEASRQTESPPDWAYALDAVDAVMARADSLLAGVEDSVAPELMARVHALREEVAADHRDQRAAGGVEELLLWSHGAEPPLDEWLAECRELFAPFDIAPGGIPAADAGARVAAQRPSVRLALLRGALAWHGFAVAAGSGEREWLAGLACAAAAAGLERSVVEAAVAADLPALARIAAEPSATSEPLPRLWLLADVLHALRVDGAEAALRRALVRHPGDFWLNHRLGLLLAAEGRPQAVSYLRISASQRPRRVIVNHHLASALMRFGAAEEGLVLSQAMARLIATCPESHPAQYTLAVEHAQRVVDASPEVGPAWNTLGMAHYRNGDYGRAVEALRRSIDLQAGGDCLDWLFLAMALHRHGAEATARTWYEKAAEQIASSGGADAELLRLLAEAEQVLGVTGQ